MSAHSLPCCCLCLVCCATLIAADAAHGQLTIGDIPLNRTTAWEKQVKLLQQKPRIGTVPSLRIPDFAAPPSAFFADTNHNVPSPRIPGSPVADIALNVLNPLEVPQEWRARITRASHRHGVAKALLAAMLMAESNFNPRAVSPKGARGAMQIMPDTGRELGLRDMFDPEANLDAGAEYLASLLRKFPRLELALAAYNAGPGAVWRHGGVPPYEETQTYVARVLALYSRYSGWR